MKACLLFIFVLISLVHCQKDIVPFLTAFPNGNESAFADLPKEAFFNELLPPYVPQPLIACPSIPIPADTDDVNNLKPGNIKVVMSMGDSIVAAMSAKDTNILNLREYRGISFSIGADSGVNTFPNILKQYTSTLVGGSVGIGTITMAGNGFNGAVSGAINQDMLGQAKWLVNALNAHPNVDIQKDWKVLTIWIGSNNLCAVCNNDTNNNGLSFENNIVSTLNYLYGEFPRLFVNLVANLDISTLYSVNQGSCGFLHSIECACVGTSDAVKRQKVSATAQDYIKRAFEIADRFNARKSPNQAVVVQPFLSKNVISDRSLLSAADCFHPSASAHSLAATALWNNMLSPAASKKTSWDASDSPVCATANSIFHTN